MPIEQLDQFGEAARGAGQAVNLADHDQVDRAGGDGGYRASKVAAESELRGSGLNCSILRLAFVYGDGDGHLASVPPIVERFKWHPAKTYSLVHQRDVAGAVELALTGAMDGLVVIYAMTRQPAFVRWRVWWDLRSRPQRSL